MNKILPDFPQVQKLCGKKIAVTGSAGYLAANLLRVLKDVDCHIFRVTRPKSQLLPLEGVARIEAVAGDIREETFANRILEEVDIVFHFAAQTSTYLADQDPAEDFKANVSPIICLLETCRKKSRHPIILFASTVTVVGIPDCLPVNEDHKDHPITAYDLHKKVAEEFLLYFMRRGFVSGAILRLANVYGPGPSSSRSDRGILNQMIRKALAGEDLPLYGKGDCLRDYVYVEDIVRAFLAAAAAIDRVNGQRFVIGTGKGHTLSEALNLVADRVARRSGHSVRVVNVVPPRPQPLIEMRNFVADSKRFFEAAGWRPQCSLAVGIDRTIDAMS